MIQSEISWYRIRELRLIAAVLFLGSILGSCKPDNPASSTSTPAKPKETSSQSKPCFRTNGEQTTSELKQESTHPQTVTDPTSPQLTPPLEKATEDSNGKALPNVPNTLAGPAQAGPACSAQITALGEDLKEGNDEVRVKARKSFVALVKANPGCRDQILSTLEEALEDRNGEVRSNAGEGLVDLVKADPSCRDQVLKILGEAFKHRDDGVVSNAMNTIINLVKADFGCKDQALQLLNQIIDRNEAMKADWISRKMDFLRKYAPFGFTPAA